jgi:hypothetical protein
MAISQQRAEAYERVRKAIADSYDAAFLVAQGKLSAQEAELVSRQGLSTALAGMSMETYSELHDGNAVALCSGNDLALEQLAAACGGRTELHALLLQPLSRDDLLAAASGYERADVSDLAAQREREAAHAKMQHLRDEALVERGQLSQGEFDDAHGDNFRPSNEIVDASEYIRVREEQDKEIAEVERRARHSHGEVRATGPSYKYWGRPTG